jgi:glucoamylase
VPRFDYGLTTPRLDTLADDLVVVYGGADALVLQSELPFGDAERSATEGNRTLRAGEEAFVVLTYELPHELDPQRLTGEEVHRKLEETVGHWTAWSDRCTYHGPYREQVLRSALVLKGLTNAPTGSIVAAPTTSLPEEVGGVRNWDYRFCWLRDSALTLNALFALGYLDEAQAYMGWLQRTTAGRAQELQIMYGVGGERLPGGRASTGSRATAARGPCGSATAPTCSSSSTSRRAARHGLGLPPARRRDRRRHLGLRPRRRRPDRPLARA